jgi:hypothetical protein
LRAIIPMAGAAATAGAASTTASAAGIGGAILGPRLSEAILQCVVMLDAGDVI